jgi:peroxiredoxin
MLCLQSPAQLLHGIVGCDAAINQKVFLKKLYLNNMILIDSCTIQGNGSFYFQHHFHSLGYYQLGLSDTNCIELILNPIEPEVEFYFSNIFLKDGVVVLKSNENQLLWTNKHLSKSFLKHKKQLYIKRSWVPKNDSVSRSNFTGQLQWFDSIQISFIEAIAKQYPTSFFAKTALLSLPRKGLTESTYFNDIDFNDSTLLHSPVFQIRIIGFLLAYTQYTETGFKDAINRILTASSVNERSNSFCLNYLLELFDKLGPEVVFQYIVENYVLKNACVEEMMDEHFMQRASSYKLLLPGNKAQNFNANNQFGQAVELDSLLKHNRYVVLFFWSSGCEFCKGQIRALKNEYKSLKDKGIEVLGISLDSDLITWQDYLKSEQLPWLNVHILKSWASEVAQLYKINKTPTFYLVTSSATIAARPNNVMELSNILTFLKPH